MTDTTLQPFPTTALIEGIPVIGLPNPQSLFERISYEIRQPYQAIIQYLNIHVANTAWHDHALREALLESTFVYCDGAGIVLGSKLLGQPLPCRLTAADWFTDLLRFMAERGQTVYLLGGEPGVPQAALEVIEQEVPHHTVIGAHHGYILKSPEKEQRVIHEINALKPDLLIVGFGTPLQEHWVARNRGRLQVPAIYCIGAVMDFMSGKVPRCPAWMGDHGLEWLYRLFTEPKRLMGRYVIGNPWFLSRIAAQAGWNALSGAMTRTPATASKRYFT